MATLVLGGLGRALGGPLGGIVGSFIGGFADRAIFGGGKPREGARAGNLAVQASTYGDPIPRLHGAMRVAGNLIWTTGIAEHASTSGGGKRGGAKVTNYAYTASFAVALSARPVVRVGRIWADGKLLRDASGGMVLPAIFRLHRGGEGQAADPLIAAAEANAPAYRGTAYIVFEDLALAEYGNRIPNLTFEVFADEGELDAALVVTDLCRNLRNVDVAGDFPAIAGHVAARTGSVREQLSGLTDLLDIVMIDDGTRLTLRSGPVAAGQAPTAGDYNSVAGAGETQPARSEALAPASAAVDAVALGFYDVGRDFQPGLQRAVRRAPAERMMQLDVPLALGAAGAKLLATGMLVRGSAARVAATVSLPPRALTLRAGEAVLRPGDIVPWRIRRWTLSGFAVELELARLATGTTVAGPADAGRVHDAGDAPPGATVLHVLDIAGLPGVALASAPRLWLAAAGALPGWRRAPVALSLDDGGSYASAGLVGMPSVIGVLATGLAAGSAELWNRSATVEVRLLNEAMWLAGRDESAVLSGANLAVIGDELVQFADAVALGGGAFRLSTLLRGRRGGAVAAHPAGTRFVLLDAERLLALDLDAEQVGRTLRLRAEGAGDSGAGQSVLVEGRSVRPLAPVFLRRTVDSGDLVFDWVRRSRSGFAWLDGVDAPLGEDAESYALTLSVGGVVVRRAAVVSAGWRYTAAMRAADGVSGAASLAVAQSGGLAGLAATLDFILS